MLATFVFASTSFPVQATPAHQATSCSNPGWFPEQFGLKDHHVFWYGGYYYLVSIYVPLDDPSPFAEDRFAYARSKDLCKWEQLPFIPATRLPGASDVKAIWAPFVFQENGVFYMYYTSVTEAGTQKIRLATTSDPSDPNNWQTTDMVFTPSHAGTIWQEGDWADCRDPMLLKIGNAYYLYYTGADIAGGIIGLAIGATPAGPWYDFGPVVKAEPGQMLESPTLVPYDKSYFLFYNLASVGGYYRAGQSPTGPWQDPRPFRPGWAHEVWQDVDQVWRTSYLTNYTITISPLTWDDSFDPQLPWIGSSIFHDMLPLILRAK